MKITARIIMILFALTYLLSAREVSANEKYMLVRITGSQQAISGAMKLADVHIDHAIRKENYVEAWLSQSEFDAFKKTGIQYQVIIPDWETHYGNFPKMSDAEIRKSIEYTSDALNISHSIYGTMGGFLKWTEVIAKLDSMRAEYPQLISAKFSIGNTIESRPIWTVRVTKNPDAPTGRPEVWYHSMIHCREPESMQHMIFYMYWLFENYGTDPVATYILENRELYFTPVLNPDGYVYNQSTNPNGGGMWRKNRRNNGGSYGIDLNRNYGIYQYWNSVNGGSSTSPSSDTYRGPSPFSEPETMAAMNFVNSRSINAIMGSHTYGNYIIKPWAWQDPTPTPDDYKFNQYLADMSATNGYTTGTPTQTVGYAVRGGADDWYYNDSTHLGHRIMAMTPETGTTGFWPTQAEIIPLAEGMLFSNQYMALIGGPYVSPVSSTFNKQTYVSGESGTYKSVFLNKGVLNALNVNVSLKSASYYLSVPVDNFGYALMSSFQKDSANFGFNISPAVPQNSAMPLVYNITQDNDTVLTEKKYVAVGSGNLTLADSAENGFTKWSTNQGWATTTTQYYSATRSFTDSPTGNYVNNANNSMTLTAPLNLSTTPVVFLSFWHKYNTEAGYDFCNVEVSSDNGTTWNTVKAYNGILSTWTFQSFDVTSYANSSSQFKVRFRLFADAGVVADGWYVDNIKLNSYNLLESAVNTPLTLTYAPQAFRKTTGLLSMRDTFSVSLRSNVSPFNIVETVKGVIDSVSYQGVFNFKNVPSGNYYIAVNHRNSIETWSKAGGEAYMFGVPLSYDFTTSASQAYGNNLAQIGSAYFGYSGDVNQDGLVDASDASIVDNDSFNGLSGYNPSDVNGDGYIDGSDALYVDNNASAFVQKLTP